MRKALKQNIIDALNNTFANESSLILFCEGTRSTPEKLATTQTPYQYLLPAKTGGVAMGLTSMLKSNQPIRIVDLTLIYRGAQPSMTNILLGRIHRVEIHIEQVPTPDWLEEDLLSPLPKRTRLKNGSIIYGKLRTKRFVKSWLSAKSQNSVLSLSAYSYGHPAIVDNFQDLHNA